MTPKTDAAKIVWKCERCGQRIADRAGWITVKRSAVTAFEAALAAWERHDPAGLYVTAAELATRPSEPAWTITHTWCDHDPDDGTDYPIHVERIRTEADVIRWTAHLLGKPWVAHTRWDDVLTAALEGADR